MDPTVTPLSSINLVVGIINLHTRFRARTPLMLIVYSAISNYDATPHTYARTHALMHMYTYTYTYTHTHTPGDDRSPAFQQTDSTGNPKQTGEEVGQVCDGHRGRENAR